MRLLVDCAPLSMGGGVQVAIALLLNLRATPGLEWQAVVCEQMRPALGPELSADPRLIFVWKRRALDFLELSAKLSAIERRFAPDVVFTVFGPTYFKPRAPHVMGFALPNLIYDATCDQTQRSLMDRAADRLRVKALQWADRLVVETGTVRQRLHERLGIPSGRISVIGNSVNPVLMQATPGPPADSGRFSVLIPAAYYKHKNLRIVPRVAAELKVLNPDLDFVLQLTLAPSSEHWASIRSQAERLGAGDVVATLGPLSLGELAGAYQRSSAVMLPTLREASTAVYPEAFFMQRPLVTSDADFARELCGNAALFADPYDPVAFARALDRLARDRPLGRELAASGQLQLARMYPSAHVKFEQQLALLQTAIDDRARGRTSPPSASNTRSNDGRST